MSTVQSIMTALKSKGKENTRAIYARHGNAPERVLGVSAADMKSIAKTLKGQQRLACELYATGVMEAMYLAGMVADGSKLSKEQLKEWADSASGVRMVAEHTVPWLAVENAHGRDLALEWIQSKKEQTAAAGWATYAGLVSMLPDEKLDLNEIERLLQAVVKEIHTAPNRVRHKMNSFVISAGSYVKPLLQKAKKAARQIGEVTVDMGETACKEPLATVYIEKAESTGRIGKKRKTIRC